MKTVPVFASFLLLILFLSSCQKDAEVPVGDNLEFTEHDPEKDINIDMSMFKFDNEEKLVLNLTCTIDKEGKKLLTLSQTGIKTSQVSQYNQYITGGSRLRLNWSKAELQHPDHEYEINVSGIVNYYPGGCGARYRTKIPHDLYSHVTGYWSYSRRESSTVGPNATSYFCMNNLGAQYWYTSVEYRDCEYKKPDVNGYNSGGFTIDNDDWGFDPDTDVTITIRR